LVKINNSTFAIPFSSIIRSVYIDNSDIKSVAETDMAVIDGNDIPLISLKKILSISVENSNTQDKKRLAVLIEKGNETAGLIIDKLIGEEEIIVRPLPSVLKGAKGFSGSTILGDGDTILILDATSFL
jgi:two-component system chemotaxis sensor kinase CheA